MMWLLAGIVALAVFLGLSSAFTQANSRKLATALRLTLGVVSGVIAALLFFSGRSGMGIFVAALSAYLFTGRNFFGRSFDFGKKRQAQTGRAPMQTRMSREKAADILGVNASAGPDEINARYRELMKRVHPDQGGSPALATQINEARDVLLGEK